MTHSSSAGPRARSWPAARRPRRTELLRPADWDPGETRPCLRPRRRRRWRVTRRDPAVTRAPTRPSRCKHRRPHSNVAHDGNDGWGALPRRGRAAEVECVPRGVDGKRMGRPGLPYASRVNGPGPMGPWGPCRQRGHRCRGCSRRAIARVLERRVAATGSARQRRQRRAMRSNSCVPSGKPQANTSPRARVRSRQDRGRAWTTTMQHRHAPAAALGSC